MPAADVADARAEQLLDAHLSPDQRSEWSAVGRITVVKHGFVWSIVLRELSKVLPLLALLAVPGWRVVAFILFVAILVGSKPFWVPRFSLAMARRREWVVSPHASPVAIVRGREVRFCALFREQLPAADRVLAWKQLLEVSEAHFLKKANIRG